MFRVSMPKLETADALVETATKWRATAAGSRSAASSQLRAACALASVSWVVKVFEQTMKSVSAGSSARTASAKSVPSMFETKAIRSPRSA